MYKTNIPGLYKDPITGVVINKNTSEYESIKAQRKKLKEAANLKKEVAELKQDMNEIKNLLRQLVNK
jgi:hypothetical protein